jgi:hypothetical protein
VTPTTVTRHAPRDCPVCGDRLVVTRLGCGSCGTELSGQFEPCDFCSLGPDDRSLLRVFLASRGNMKDLERHLGVSYPTARARFDALLARLGLEREAASAAPDPASSLDVLHRLADGQIDVDEALGHLR